MVEIIDLTLRPDPQRGTFPGALAMRAEPLWPFGSLFERFELPEEVVDLAGARTALAIARRGDRTVNREGVGQQHAVQAFFEFLHHLQEAALGVGLCEVAEQPLATPQRVGRRRRIAPLPLLTRSLLRVVAEPRQVAVEFLLEVDRLPLQFGAEGRRGDRGSPSLAWLQLTDGPAKLCDGPLAPFRFGPACRRRLGFGGRETFVEVV
ncbi:MAG: hypothetical protein FJ265_22185 [Planctomycetes bacterium]|nr:hypothetical protein [Planctomycetota bacterium]